MSIGDYIRFEYHGKVRSGRIDKVSVSKDGLEYVVVKLADGFRSFYVSEMIIL